MSAPWVVAELRPLGSGEWLLAARRTAPTLYQARRFASLFTVEPDTAVVVGQPSTRELHITGCVESNWSQNSAQAQLRKWLNWLRAIGVVRLEVLDEVSAPQVIPAVLSPPSVHFSEVRRCRTSMRAELFRKGVRRDSNSAPKGSVLELVERAGQLDRFVLEYADIDDNAWATLRTPLLMECMPLLQDADIWSFGALIDTGSGVGPQFARVRISGIDRDCIPFVQDYPIDPLGLGWPYVDRLGPSSVDSVFKTPQVQEPLEILDRLPTLLRRILLEAYSAGHGWERGEEVDCEEVAKCWESVLAPGLSGDIGRVRDEFVRRLGPNGTRGYRPDIVRYISLSPTEAVRQRREQAFDVACGAMQSVMDGLLPRAAAAIDDAKPLLSAIARDLGISSKVVRKALNGVKGNSVGTAPSFLEIAHLLRDLGPHCPAPGNDTFSTLLSLRRNLLATFNNKRQGSCDRAVRSLFWAIGRSAVLSGWTTSFQRDWESICGVHVEAAHDLIGLAERSVSLFLSNAPEYDGVLDASNVADRWLKCLSLEELSNLAIGWHFLSAGELSLGECILKSGDQPYVPPLRACSWVPNRMRIEILDTKEKLFEEAQAMANCVSAYWRQVCSYALVLVSMTAPDESRATLSLAMTTSGQWRIQEASGPGNQLLDANSVFVETAESFCQWLADHPLNLDAAARECLNSARESYFRVLAIAADPAVTVQDFPADLQHVPLGHLPGKGYLETRMRHVIRRIQRAQANHMRGMDSASL